MAMLSSFFRRERCAFVLRDGAEAVKGATPGAAKRTLDGIRCCSARLMVVRSSTPIWSLLGMPFHPHLRARLALAAPGRPH